MSSYEAIVSSVQVYTETDGDKWGFSKFQSNESNYKHKEK